MSVMRSVLLAASQNRWLRERAANYKFVRRSVSRFMPGETLDDALGAAGALKNKKIRSVLTQLGENVTDRAEAQRVADHYLEVLRRIRATSRLPVLLLTARGEDVDRIVGLEIGADDYLPKPFNPRELVARIRAVLRRTRGDGSGSPAAPEVVTVGDVELDPATRTVKVDGKPVELTSVEFNLLEVLLREAGRVVPRERLVNAVLSRKFSPFDRSIDMHVSKVRKKLGDTENDEHIKTVRGVGYIFARPREKVKT